MYSRDEPFLRSRELFWYWSPSLLHNSGNEHQNNPLVSAETVRHSSTYIILYIFMLYCIFSVFTALKDSASAIAQFPYDIFHLHPYPDQDISKKKPQKINLTHPEMIAMLKLSGQKMTSAADRVNIIFLYYHYHHDHHQYYYHHYYCYHYHYHCCYYHFVAPS